MKIRQCFVSNSSSSAFILPLSSLTSEDLSNLGMAFGQISINDRDEVIITYSMGSDLAIKIINGLLGNKCSPRKTNVS